MPKKIQDKKSKSKKSESSSKSKPSVSSSSKSKSCAQDKCKKLDCHKKVKVDVDLIPQVKISKECNKNASFDVGVDIKHFPKCKIVPVKDKAISDCHGQCLFRVEVENRYEAVPRILNDCRFPTAEFSLDINAHTKQRCQVDGSK